MKQLEMSKESLERRKASRMNQAMYAFVDGKVPQPLAYAHLRGTANSAIEEHRSTSNYAESHGFATEVLADDFALHADGIAALSLQDDRSTEHDLSKVDPGSYAGTSNSGIARNQNQDENSHSDQEDRGALFARASFLMKDALDATGWSVCERSARIHANTGI